MLWTQPSCCECPTVLPGRRAAGGLSDEGCIHSKVSRVQLQGVPILEQTRSAPGSQAQEGKPQANQIPSRSRGTGANTAHCQVPSVISSTARPHEGARPGDCKQGTSRLAGWPVAWSAAWKGVWCEPNPSGYRPRIGGRVSAQPSTSKWNDWPKTSGAIPCATGSIRKTTRSCASRGSVATLS